MGAPHNEPIWRIVMKVGLGVLFMLVVVAVIVVTLITLAGGWK